MCIFLKRFFFLMKQRLKPWECLYLKMTNKITLLLMDTNPEETHRHTHDHN